MQWALGGVRFLSRQRKEAAGAAAAKAARPEGRAQRACAAAAPACTGVMPMAGEGRAGPVWP